MKYLKKNICEWSNPRLEERHGFNHSIKLHFTFCKHAPD